MLGSEHYLAAEALLVDLPSIAEDWEQVQATIAMAQVHATLALAAATAWGAEKGHNRMGIGVMADRGYGRPGLEPSQG